MRFVVNIPIENEKLAAIFLKRALYYAAMLRYRELNIETDFFHHGSSASLYTRALSSSEQLAAQTGITIDGIELSKL